MSLKNILKVKKTIIYILGLVIFFLGCVGVIMSYNIIDLSKDLYLLRNIYNEERKEYMKFLTNKQYDISEGIELAWERFTLKFPGADSLPSDEKIRTFYNLIINPITDINKNDMIIIITDKAINDYKEADVQTKNKLVYKDFYRVITTNDLDDTRINVVKFEDKTYRVLRHVIADGSITHSVYISFIEEDINAYLNRAIDRAIMDLKDKIVFVIVALGVMMLFILFIIILMINILFKLSYHIEYSIMKGEEFDEKEAEEIFSLGNGVVDEYVNHRIDGDPKKSIDYNKYKDVYGDGKPKNKGEK